VLVCGPYGTGKSIAILNKLYYLATKYDNARILIVRKIRKDLTESALVTFESRVVPEGDPILQSGPQRITRSSYVFPNKSEIILCGLDNPGKVLSAEYDVIYVMEAVQLTESDWNTLVGRLRWNRLPFQQLIGDCNPSSPNHWLKQRCDRGQTRLITTTHEDNPVLWDKAKNTWTTEGKRYVLGTLGGYKGTDLRRYRYGEWASVEGARFPHASPDIQGFDPGILWPSGVPNHYAKFCSVDWGIADPYCCLWHAVAPNGDLYTYREDTETRLTTDQQALRVITKTGSNEAIQAVYMDPSMWNKSTTHSGHEEPGPAYIYEKILGQDDRFGKVRPGNTRKKRQEALSTLDALLNRTNEFPNWYISTFCVTLWKELQDATYESLEKPRGTNDHAITSAYYGLMSHKGKAEEMTPNIIYYDDVRAARYKRLQEEAEASFFKTMKRFRVR
jgi:PBSX family phage terminase large subunit